MSNQQYVSPFSSDSSSSGTPAGHHFIPTITPITEPSLFGQSPSITQEKEQNLEGTRKKRPRTEDVVAEILSDKPDPKRQHVLRDKARRHDLNDGIERLRKLLSFELGPRPTKSDIVNQAADTLAKLQSQVSQLSAYLHQLQSSPSVSSPPLPTSSGGYAVPMASPQAHSFNFDPSGSSTQSSSGAGLFFAFFFVFIVGSFSPVSQMAAPVTRTLLWWGDASSGSTSLLSYATIYALLSIILYLARLFSTSYVQPNSIKFQRVKQTMRSWNAFKSDRATFRIQANLVRQLLGRQLPTVSAYWLILMYIEVLRFILLRLRIGLVIERAVLFIKGVQPEVLEMEISSALAWCETKPSWDSYVVVLECIRSLNLMEIAKHTNDNTNLIFLKLSFYYLIGNLIGYRGALWKPLGLWCLWCASSLADSAQDPNSTDTSKPFSSPNEMSLSRTSALLGAVGISTFKEFARNGQSASKEILAGRISLARLKFEDTLKALEPALSIEPAAPLLRKIHRGTRSIMIFLKYLTRSYGEYAQEAVELFKEADKYDDRELSLTLMIIIIYTKCWAKDDHSMLQTRRLTSYCRTRFQTSLSSDVMMGFTLSLSEIIVEIYDERILHALALLESSADFLEEHKSDPRLLVAPMDFSRLCLRMIKIVSESEDPDIRETLPRVMDVSYRATNIVEVQSVSAKFAEALFLYYRGRLELIQTRCITSDGDSLRSAAKKRFERCSALCREIGLQDWGWLLLKCEKRISLIDNLNSPHRPAAHAAVLTQRKTSEAHDI
jgi:hypothetical protein